MHKTQSIGIAYLYWIGGSHGSNKESYETVRRWKKILTAIESFKDAAKPGWPLTVRSNASDSKVREIINSDGRYRICDIAIAVCISLSRVHFFLKRILKARKISAWWIPYILKDDHNKSCTNHWAVAKIVTDDFVVEIIDTH